MQTRATDSCHRDPDTRHRRSRRARAALVLLLAACDPGAADEPTVGKPAPEPTCEQTACRHVADCSPTLTGGVDWRTPEACLASGWECYEPEACLAAVAALPCLSDPPTQDELDASTRAFVALRRECLGPPY